MTLRITSILSWLWGVEISVLKQFRTHLITAYIGWKSICQWFCSCFTELVGFGFSSKKLDDILSQVWRWYPSPEIKCIEITHALLFLSQRLRNLTSYCHYLCSRSWIGFFQNRWLMYKGLQFNTRVFFPCTSILDPVFSNWFNI